MKSTNHLLPYLVYVTLFVICEATTPSLDLSASCPNTFGINIPAASDKTCVNDKSPAESCFDYFILAIFWAPGYGYKLKLDSIPIRDNIQPKWVIHGLWPSMSSKNVPIPQRCYRNNIYFNPSRLSQGGLRGKLNQSWYSLINNGASSNDKFWEHEFKAHGNCATRSTAIKDDYNYFAKTYELFEKLNIGTVLSNKRYRPGTSDKLRAIIKIIEDKVGKKVKVDYVTNPKTKINYLKEVFVCYNIGLKAFIDCPNSNRAVSELEKNVLYLENLPK